MVVRSALRTGHLYPQEMLLVLISVKRLSRPQGHSAIGKIMSMKFPMTPSGIEPATFRFVAQYLNHCATISGPRSHSVSNQSLCVTLSVLFNIVPAVCVMAFLRSVHATLISSSSSSSTCLAKYSFNFSLYAWSFRTFQFLLLNLVLNPVPYE
jgi:hypothetical protein